MKGETLMKHYYASLFLLTSIFSFGQEIPEEVLDSIDYNPIEINEIIIKGQRKKNYADKSVYTFDQAALEKARYSKDLLATLPELEYDFINNTVKSTKGGTTLFLINGIESTDAQLRMVKPDQVVRVEYFDIPPSRWANRADQVINVITRNPENGYSYGIDTNSAFNTGFVNASAYANYTQNKHDFGFEYYFNLRDYDDRHNSNTIKYRLNDLAHESNKEQVDHFGYTYQNATLRYTNAGERATFQAKTNLELTSYFSHANGINLFTLDQLTTHHTTQGHDNNNYVKPTLDIYYSTKIGKKDELMLNAIGSHYKTKSYQMANEWETESLTLVFENVMNLEAIQTSMVGEIAHVHQFGKNTLNSGYRISSNKIDNELVNLLGESRYDVHYLENYLYTEFGGKTNKIMYRIGAGLMNINNKSADSRQNDWSFTPKLILGYELAKNQSLRLSSSYQPRSPWSEALSSNVIQFAPNIVRQGNPYLEPEKQFRNNLNYSFNSKYVDLNGKLMYYYTSNAINQYFMYVEPLNAYALTYDNVDYSSMFGFQLSGSIKPFGNDLLNLKVVLTPAMEQLRNKEGRVLKNDYFASTFSLSSVYKNFSLYYQYNIPVYTLNGAFLNTNENNNHLFLNYNYKDFKFQAGMYWIGMPSEYKTKTLDNSLVDYTSLTRILNNKNMLTIGVSFDFSKGKQTKIDRQLNNDTAPAATF